MKLAGMAVAVWILGSGLAHAGTASAPADQQETAMSGPETIHPATANLRFGRWIEEFRSRAIAQGISPETFAAAFRGVEYNTCLLYTSPSPRDS